MTEPSRQNHRLRIAIRALVVLALIAAAGLGSAAVWLLYTAPGFAWTIARLGNMAGDSLVLEGVQGTLSGGMTMRRIRYAHEDGTTIEARDVTLRISPASLFVLAPRVSDLQCAELSLTLAATDGPATRPASLALPVRLQVEQARIGRIAVKQAQATVEAMGITFGYSADTGGHRIENAAFELYGIRIAISGTVGAATPFPVDVSLTATRQGAPQVKLIAQIKGPLDTLQLAAEAGGAGGSAKIEGVLSPFEPLPVDTLRATLSGLDLRAVDASLPRTEIDGALSLRRASGAKELGGHLSLKNRLAGVYDRGRLPLDSLDAELRTDLARVRATGRAGLGAAGQLAGTAEFAPQGATLALRTDHLNLAGLHGSLHATRLSGRIDARLSSGKQTVIADLADRNLQLALRGERTGDNVALHELLARARGGEARGTGRVALSGARAFSAEARMTAFDPSAWGSFPPGTVNGRLTARGTLAAEPVVEAEFALEPSRLRGAPLAGSARASLRGERVTALKADLDWGGNRVNAMGAWGGANDVLTASVDAPRLTVVHPDWAGRIAGTARLTGSWRVPGVQFETTGNKLVFAGRARLEALSGRGEFSARADAPLRLAATASGLIAGNLRLERASIDVDGTRTAHGATLRAQGSDIDLVARARGGWQAPGGWSGTVQELENRGQYPVVLEAPLAIETASRRLRMGRLAARIAGGRLDIAEIRYEEGRLASQGRFNDLRAGIALALAGAAPDAGGTVRLSGTWALTSTPRWNGTLSIRRESGDLSLAAQNAMPLGLDALSLDARIVDDRVDFRGALRSRVANGRVEGTISPVAGPEGVRLAPDSPLKFTANLEVARFAALASETALSFDGRLRAAVTGGGTLRDPLLRGTVEGDEISIAYAPEGVDLRNGVLRAELADREIVIQSFSIRGGDGEFRASGTLARGDVGRAALAWEAQRLTIMGRPGRRIVVSGRGKATLEDAKVALLGELRADEGEIELRAGGLPAPGDDVVIVGRQRSAAETPRLRQAALDLTLDFGDRFRIAGRGLNTALSGKIRVETSVAGNLVAKGSVQAVRGTYTAFGQRLDLERGRLVFEGPIDNPTLDIRAMRKMSSVEAGVEVAGTLHKPFVRVVSEPAMPENEALSWLILGHAPGDATGADLSMLPLAAAALLGQGDTVGTGGVARAFGLDSVGLRGGGTTGSQFITFGKRLADNVYIAYEQSMGATANVLKLELNLTRRLLLRAETGQTSAIGMFYRWAFD